VIVDYIRTKHADSYTDESLLAAKRSHAPTLNIRIAAQEQVIGVQTWLDHQSFRDWTLGADPTTSVAPLYEFFFSNVDALRRLPRETLECSLMLLESYPKLSHCVIAVKNDCISLLASGVRVDKIVGNRYPVALITKPIVGQNKTPMEVLGNCDLIAEFPDQEPRSDAGWAQELVSFSKKSEVALLEDLEAFRKDLSAFGKRVIPGGIYRLCIEIYDYIYYRLLCSDTMFALRAAIGNAAGETVGRKVSAVFYSLFLTVPPPEENMFSRRIQNSSPEAVSPLFLTPPDHRIHVLIATNWLIEGGVEQIIFDLCRLLDPTRFRLSIATTAASSQTWDSLARTMGVSVYHLADFLKPTEMANGFVHLILNHQVDCLYIMNSHQTYRFVKTLKKAVPWMPIIDRVEAPDPGGGFPMLSAKIGREFVDLRTVSHRKLAEDMRRNYGVPQSSLRVIYIGANVGRIKERCGYSGLLHQKCHINQAVPVVIFVGRFAEQKRPDVFVRSVAKILALRPDCEAHFAMVGDGILMDAIKALVSKYRLGDRIHLLGAHQNAVELLAGATILLMPSAYEGIAVVSYEAMTLGIPQIFANVNGQSELITPETGILIDNGPGEEARYAEACLDLLADPARRARMAEAGKKRIREHFTAEKAVAEYARIFEELAEQSRRRAKEIPHLRPPHINPLHLALG
jgi:glycosyltransferase involved in cell wall biosynthesis